MSDISLNDSLLQELYQIRRQLHQYPELSFKEYETFKFIVSRLEKWNISYTKIGETGLFVDIKGEQKGPNIGIRADIDGLPIQEQTNINFSSKYEGVMHACGHDGHTTILLGVVYILNQLRQRLCGTVRCIFQPGEEEDGAAKHMIEKGVLDDPKIDAMLALHIWPHLPFGSVGIRYGCITAGCDDFIIEIIGKSGHAGRPHKGLDAIAISAQVIQSFQFLITKLNNPIDPIVINVGKIIGGTANNVIPEKVTLEGTIRTTSKVTREKVLLQLKEMVENTAKLYGGISTIQFVGVNPPIENDEIITNLVQRAAEKSIGKKNVLLLTEPSMGADDFGVFAERVPSSYFRLGVNEESRENFDLHHPNFYFDETIIPIGIKVFTQTILNWFSEKEDNNE